MGDIKNDDQVPSFYMCPISLEIMKDPVTLSTGITYDRGSIEKWLLTQTNKVCPVTKQAIVDIDLTPNLTLHRLIQSWCILNPLSSIEIFPKPQLSITKSEIIKLLKDSKSLNLQMKSLRRLKTLVLENETNKRMLESEGVVDFLVSILSKSHANMSSSSPTAEVSNEALSILYHLKLSPTSIKSLFEKTTNFAETLTHFMEQASFESRATTVMLLKSLFEVANPMQITSLNTTFFTELVRILMDQISQKATKATLELLINICPWGRNKIKAAEAGAIPTLIDMLIGHPEKKVSEMVIILLEQFCQCAEGRAELLQHGAGLAVVSKKIFRVSTVASESAVRILHLVMKFSGNRSVVQEMLQLGVVGKLCLVMQVDCGKKMKEKAKEILKMNSRVWKNSHCIPNNLVCSYPS